MGGFLCDSTSPSYSTNNWSQIQTGNVSPSSYKVSAQGVISGVRLFATPWTAGRQAPLSTELSRQNYWSGLPFPTPGDLPDPGTEPAPPALALEAYSLPLLHLLNPNKEIKLHRSIFVLLSCPDPKN